MQRVLQTMALPATLDLDASARGASVSQTGERWFLLPPNGCFAVPDMQRSHKGTK